MAFKVKTIQFFSGKDNHKNTHTGLGDKTIHSSLAIENNTLSLKQVTDIIDGKRCCSLAGRVVLKSLGIIVRVGSNKTGYWKVNI